MPKRTSKSTRAIPRTELSTVPFDRIHHSSLNPRTDFPAKGIRDLAATIEEDGLLEALMVRPAPDREGHFEIAAGERRFRALEHLREQGRIPADWPVPVQVREIDDQELLTLALVETLLREDLHPLDEGFAYKRLVDEGVRTAEIARRVKRTQRHVQLRIQLTSLDPEVRKAFRAGEIQLAQALELATAPPDRHVPTFDPSKLPPPVEPEASLAREIADRLAGALASEVLSSPEKATSPLDRISEPEDARRLFEASGEVPQDVLLSLLRTVVAARVGSTALRGDNAPLVAHLARDLRATPDSAPWLTPDYLQHYPKARLIRLALDSGAVPRAEAESLEDLTRRQIIQRILDSDTRDEDYLPPELSFTGP